MCKDAPTYDLKIKDCVEKLLSMSKNNLKLIVEYKNQELYFYYTDIEDKIL